MSALRLHARSALGLLVVVLVPACGARTEIDVAPLATTDEPTDAALPCYNGSGSRMPEPDGSPDAHVFDAGATRSAAGSATNGNVIADSGTPGADGNGPDNRVTAVSAGQRFTCALEANGGAHCWGSNESGQLGNGTTVASSKPSAVSLPAMAAAIATGGAHACALMADEGVRCWGLGASGQLGNGATNDSAVPVRVAGLSGAVAIAAGGDQSCALLDAGIVECWGFNAMGELGNGTTISSSLPVTSLLAATAAGVTVGGDHSCAWMADGTAECWGDNGFGQLGDGLLYGRPDAGSCPRRRRGGPNRWILRYLCPFDRWGRCLLGLGL